MRRGWGVWLALLAAGGLLGAPAVAAWAAEGAERQAENVEMADETWFYRFRNLPREAPGDLQDGPAGPALGSARAESNLYDHLPPGSSTLETLHVGVLAGQPEARMFLGLPTVELLGPDEDFGEVIITGGQITLTDAGAQHGSRAVDTADMIACRATELVIGGRGGDWPDMAGFDCATSVPVERVAGSDPAQFTIDLTPFAEAFAQDPQAQGIAIVERLVLDAGDDEPRVAAPESWHLAVHSNLTCFAEGDGLPGEDDLEVDGQACVAGSPITADLTYRVAELAVDFGGEFADGFDDGPFDDGFVDDGFFDEDVGALPADDFGDLGDGGFAEGDLAFSDESVAPGALDPESTGRAQPQAAAPVSDIPALRTPTGFYLLPLLGVGLAGLLGYSLTHEPELPAVREGAVSTLMRNRRAGQGPSA